MGWLENLAVGARFSTLGKVARAAVHRSDWPEGESRNERSIENMLRLVDQKQKKGQVWLEKRPDVREILADLLGVSAESLDPGLQEPDGPADPRVELKELREARPIDLRKESLYPGIPEEVLEPSEWGRSWWFANAGAGKTIVGKWLEARKLATWLRGDRLADVIPLLPATGPVYIEIARPDTTDATRWAEDLEERDVCVAAPFLPVPLDEVMDVAGQRKEWETAPEEERDEEEKPELDAAWTWIKTPPRDEWVEDLIRWVGERMRPGGGFNADAVLEFVQAGPWSGILDTPGEYIGICGVFEHLGAERLASASAEEFAVSFLASRIERPDLGAPTMWTPKDLFRLISGCVEGAMVNSGVEDTFMSEQALKEWMPADSLPAGDDSALLRLADVPAPSLADLDAARRRARPTAGGAIRELHRLHLLEKSGEGTVSLRPMWLALVAAQPAIERLIAEPDRGLGRLLLRPKAAPWPLKALRDHFLREEEEDPWPDAGWKLIERVVGSLQWSDAASVAVLEALFQAVGIALLDVEMPADAVTLRRLWDAQMRLAVNRYTNAPPQPRVFELERDSGGWENGWYVAALSISERLTGAGMAPPTSALAPWTADAFPELADQLLWALDWTCSAGTRGGRGTSDDAASPDFLDDAWRLAGRIYRRFGVPTGVPVPRTLFAPFSFVEAIKLGKTPLWSGRVDLASTWDVLARVADDDGLAIEAVLDALWRAKDEHGHAALLMHHTIPEQWRRRLWAALPRDVFAAGFNSSNFQIHSMPWTFLLPVHWDVVVDAWRADKNRRSFDGVEHLPESHARIVVRERLPGVWRRDVYDGIWERYPAMCVEEAVAELLTPPLPGEPEGAIWRTPSGRVGEVVKAVEPHLATILADPTTRAHLARWARYEVAGRGQHWEEAWRLLNAAEPCDAD